MALRLETLIQFRHLNIKRKLEFLQTGAGSQLFWDAVHATEHTVVLSAMKALLRQFMMIRGIAKRAMEIADGPPRDV